MKSYISKVAKFLPFAVAPAIATFSLSFASPASALTQEEAIQMVKVVSNFIDGMNKIGHRNQPQPAPINTAPPQYRPAQEPGFNSVEPPPTFDQPIDGEAIEGIEEIPAQ